MKSVLLSLILCAHNLCAIVVSGNATLNNQTNHAGIKLRFIQSSPTSVSDSVLTDASGNYSINLAGGLYQADFSMPGYQRIYYNNSALLLISTNTILISQVLQTGVSVPVSGNVSGVWQGTNTYQVTGHLVVPLNQTLSLAAGAVVRFLGNYSLTVYGTLLANGTAANPITISSANSNSQNADWQGIFVDAGAELEMRYCLVEKCTTGVFIDHVQAIIENSEFRYFSSTGISLNLSSSTVRSNEIHDYTLTPGTRGLVAYDGRPTVECNTFYNGSGSGINCQSDGIFKNNILHHLNLGFSCSGNTSAKISNNYIHNCNWGIRVGESVQTIVEPVITNNTLWRNQTGIMIPTFYAKPVIVNNTIAENTVGINQFNCATCVNTPSVLTHNNLWNNSGGNYIGLPIPGLGQSVSQNSNGTPVDPYFNISADPQFINAVAPNTSALSPCTGAGASAYSSCIGFEAFKLCKGLVTAQSTHSTQREFRVFPNPFTDEINLEMTAGSVSLIRLHDLNGRLLQQWLNPAESLLLDIGKLELEPGFYLLKISDCSGGNSTIKLIKEN